LISLAAPAERCARLRTSAATTAKPRPLFAGARRFYCGVQRQDVGLEGNAVDHADDVGDLAGAVFDGGHGVNHLAHHFASLDRYVGGGYHKLVGLTRVLGILLHGAGQFFH